MCKKIHSRNLRTDNWPVQVKIDVAWVYYEWAQHAYEVKFGFCNNMSSISHIHQWMHTIRLQTMCRF